jgi:hypothetical protein
MAVVDLPPSSSPQPSQNNRYPQLEAKAGKNQQQDSEEEIKAVIEDELIRLHQENELLGLSKNIWPDEGQ